MKLYSAIVSILLSLLPASALAIDVASCLEGTWVETVQYKEYPRTILHFKGNTLRFENMFGATATVEYKVTEKKADEFSITFEYRYKVKRGNGRIVERCERPDFLFHMENGRPILSETAIELDGRGLVIPGEILRTDDFVDGFQSELSRKLNSRKPMPTMMGE